MRHILLCTTVLSVFIAAAQAQAAPQVTVGGSARWEAGGGHDDLAGSSLRPYGARNDTEIDFNIENTTDSGSKYGAQINLEADVTAPARDEGTNANRTMLYYQNNYGRFEAGSTPGAAKLMKVDAATLARGSGGIEGSWKYFANNNGLEYISAPELPMAHGSTFVNGGNYTNDNVNKVGYYSPRFYGLQFGASFAPDFTDRGQIVSRDDEGVGHASDNWELGLGYENTFGEWYLAAAATAYKGHTEAHLPGVTNEAFAWNAGALVGWRGFKVAASYGDWDNSLRANDWEGRYWTAGASYERGAWGTSVTYMSSEAGIDGENEFTNVVVGTDYKLAPGLTPYAEVSLYEQDAPTAADVNKGTVAIVGTELNF